jgi:hypothetical protein
VPRDIGGGDSPPGELFQIMARVYAATKAFVHVVMREPNNEARRVVETSKLQQRVRRQKTWPNKRSNPHRGDYSVIGGPPTHD